MKVCTVEKKRGGGKCSDCHLNPSREEKIIVRGGAPKSAGLASIASSEKERRDQAEKKEERFASGTETRALFGSERGEKL